MATMFIILVIVDCSRSTIFNKFNDNEFVQKELLQTIENYRPNLLVLGMQIEE